MRALVTGGAGFLGSHLCRRLARSGWDILSMDNLLTGSVQHADIPGVDFLNRDITETISAPGHFDWILNFASPASPPDYFSVPIATLEVGSIGTLNALEFAREKGAKFLQASTSEVYGDPLQNPQRESYWGNVNPIGPRAVYDEGKRFGEAATMAYAREYDLPIRIVRIFNTYGPGMRTDDGRAIPTFITRAIRGLDLPINGDGTQTRSLCFVDDLIEGIIGVMDSPYSLPVNLGNDHEVTVLEIAKTVLDVTGSYSGIQFGLKLEDDPKVRCPDVSLARELLDWEATTPLRDGIRKTIGGLLTPAGVVLE